MTSKRRCSPVSGGMMALVASAALAASSGPTSAQPSATTSASLPGAPGVTVPVRPPAPGPATASPSVSAHPASASTASSAAAQRIEVRQADRVDYDGSTKLVVLTGAVHVVRGTLTLKADRIEIALGEDEKSVRTATATGRVEVVDGTRRAVADRAVYTENTSELLLTGSPRLWDGDNEIEADRILYNLNTRTMRAEGRVRGMFLPGGLSLPGTGGPGTSGGDASVR